MGRSARATQAAAAAPPAPSIRIGPLVGSCPQASRMPPTSVEKPQTAPSIRVTVLTDPAREASGSRRSHSSAARILVRHRDVEAGEHSRADFIECGSDAVGVDSPGLVATGYPGGGQGGSVDARATSSARSDRRGPRELHRPSIRDSGEDARGAGTLDVGEVLVEGLGEGVSAFGGRKHVEEVVGRRPGPPPLAEDARPGAPIGVGGKPRVLVEVVEGLRLVVEQGSDLSCSARKGPRRRSAAPCPPRGD